MDPETVDQQYATLQQQGQHTAQLVAALAAKLQAASAGGDQNAREWQLDLKELALAVREEEDQTGNLLQAIHTMVENHVQSAPAYQPQPGYQPGYQQPGSGIGGGGMLQRFLGGGFGRAGVTGAGFGTGDDIINHIL